MDDTSTPEEDNLDEQDSEADAGDLAISNLEAARDAYRRGNDDTDAAGTSEN